MIFVRGNMILKWLLITIPVLAFLGWYAFKYIDKLFPSREDFSKDSGYRERAKRLWEDM